MEAFHEFKFLPFVNNNEGRRQEFHVPGGAIDDSGDRVFPHYRKELASTSFVRAIAELHEVSCSKHCLAQTRPGAPAMKTNFAESEIRISTASRHLAFTSLPPRRPAVEDGLHKLVANSFVSNSHIENDSVAEYSSQKLRTSPYMGL